MFKIKIVLSLMLFIGFSKGPELYSITKESGEQYFSMKLDKVCLEVELLGPQLPDNYHLQGNEEARKTLLLVLDIYKFQIGIIGLRLPYSKLICSNPAAEDLNKDNLDYLVGVFDFACRVIQSGSMAEESLIPNIRGKLEEKFPEAIFPKPKKYGIEHDNKRRRL